VSSLPPAVTNRAGSHGLPDETPSTLRACTYIDVAPAPGASIVIFVPLPRVISICGNSGLASTRSAREGTWGYMPSAAQTYHADIVPRSSLPVIPPGVFVHNRLTICRTVAWVLAGAPM